MTETGNPFFDHPILNSPYASPERHWELDESGQPTQRTLASRRPASFFTPIPKPKKQGEVGQQGSLVFGDSAGLSSAAQQYEETAVHVNRIRELVQRWRTQDARSWGVTPETERLLRHWRHHEFQGIRPFFCQIEAVETAIWLSEVAPRLGGPGRDFLRRLEQARDEANPGLLRLALKLATGAGKTTVMAMLIAWQTINAVRRPSSKRFTRGFLIVSPGITIRDRLRVLLPSDPDSYYASRQLVPADMLDDLGRAKVVITNYHAFMLRDQVQLSKGGRSLLQGRGQALKTQETEGQMVQRVAPELMGMKNILVVNDEAHHCYREKPSDDALKGDDRKEAEENNAKARVWAGGLEAFHRKLGVRQVLDLSATPFFLRGSGYAEGTLFPWTCSDFSLMDAIECGIVKLPRVPVAENIPGQEMPVFRNLWEHIGKQMPKKGRGQSKLLDPRSLPPKLLTALDALYGHYAKTFALWQEAGLSVPPCFIIVCNNTATSKLVYDYVSGFHWPNADGSTSFVGGRLALFRNFDENGNPYARPNTLLIDSEQLESGDALDDTFRAMASDEIERFRREVVQRTGDVRAAESLSDQDLLREVMNTVGKEGRLGAAVRCVVSVSMLTEGWDASTVTHVLGVRAFGTQLLCEQVVGRALRRQSYDLGADGLLPVEYADVLGIPFDFTATPTVGPPQPPRRTVHVHAVRPERDPLEIRFPRVTGYRVELPEDLLTARFGADSTLVLSPKLVGPTITENAGIIGRPNELNLDHIGTMRRSSVLFHLTRHLLETRFRDPGESPRLHLFGQLKRIAKQWLDHHLECAGDTHPGQLAYRALADIACDRITAAITEGSAGRGQIQALVDPYNPEGTSAAVNLFTSKQSLWQTSAERCHVNWAVLDSDWEGELCRVAEAHPRVKAYVKNHGLGFEVPYHRDGEVHQYRPDFIVLVDDGHGDDLLRLVVEVKGYRGEDAKDKKLTMETYWVPGVNNLGRFGRWAFAELRDVYAMRSDFAAAVGRDFETMVERVARGEAGATEAGA